MTSFKGSQFPKDVMLFAVYFFLRYTVSYRDLEEIMAERRNKMAATKFFAEALETRGIPEKVVIEKNGANKAALNSGKQWTFLANDASFVPGWSLRTNCGQACNLHDGPSIPPRPTTSLIRSCEPTIAQVTAMHRRAASGFHPNHKYLQSITYQSCASSGKGNTGA